MRTVSFARLKPGDGQSHLLNQYPERILRQVFHAPAGSPQKTSFPASEWNPGSYPVFCELASDSFVWGCLGTSRNQSLWRWTLTRRPAAGSAT